MPGFGVVDFGELAGSLGQGVGGVQTLAKGNGTQFENAEAAISLFGSASLVFQKLADGLKATG